MKFVYFPWTPPDTPLTRAADAICRKICSCGGQARWVGGAVRDGLQGKIPADIDLVSTLRPDEIASIFPNAKYAGASFGVMLIKMQDFTFEIATAREERDYLDGRRPETVKYTTDFAVDVQRRDFTINALLYDPEHQRIEDCVGGVEDLNRGILRTVGNPERRFREDYLRMLRLVRFAARCNFQLEESTAQAAKKISSKCQLLAAERIREELTRMLIAPHPDRALLLLEALGMLQVLLPEVAAMRGVPQPPRFHPEGDVMEHTLLMLRHMPPNDPALAWSVLLHDVGKVPTLTIDPDGRERFFGHESVGSKMAEDILTRLRFDKESIRMVTSAVRNHMRFANVLEMRPAKQRQLLADPELPLNWELHRLDCACSNHLMEIACFLLDELIRRQGQRQLPPPLLTGHDLLSRNVPPGPEIGKILTEIRELQLDGTLRNRSDAFQYLRQTNKIR